MKLLILIVSIVVCSFQSKSQSAIIDSLKVTLQKANTDTGRAIILYNLSYYYQKYKPDSALIYAQKAGDLSKKNKFIKGESNSLGLKGGAYNRLGNFPKALECYIEQLKIEEKSPRPEYIASVYLNIGLVYSSEKDALNAIKFVRLADSIVEKNNLSELFLYTSLDLGDIYSNNNQLDSALSFTQRCYDESIKQKNDLITGTALNNMGNIYYKSGAYFRALDNFRRSIPYLRAMQDYNTEAECDLGLARAFDKTGDADSALYYANRSFQIASYHQFLKHALNASLLLSQLFKKQDKVDSAFTYQGNYIALKDSFENSEKVRQLQSLSISEQLRQQQIADRRVQDSKDRHLRLELLLLGMFIPISFLVSAVISRKKVHRKVIEFAGIFSLLFMFEYITLLLNPIVAKGTNDSPILEILIFVTIAAIISPTHHKIEQWLIKKLTRMHETKLQAGIRAHEQDEIQETDEG